METLGKHVIFLVVSDQANPGSSDRGAAGHPGGLPEVAVRLKPKPAGAPRRFSGGEPKPQSFWRPSVFVFRVYDLLFSLD